MITLDFPEIKKSFYLPSSLEECDNRQYADICKLLFWFHTEEINLFQFRELAVYALMNMRAKKTKYKSFEEIPEKDLQKYESIFQISELLDSFFTEETAGEKKYLKVKDVFVKNYLPSYRLFIRKYHGPKDGFKNVNFGQYLDGLEEFLYFAQTGDIKSLRMLFSIFYLPKGEEYSFEKSENRVEKIFKHTDIRHLYGFFIYFGAMQQYFQSGEIEVFGQPIDLSLIYKEVHKTGTSDVPGIGMHSILNDVAESGVYGPAESVRKTNLWTVLLRLYELKKKAIDELKTQKQNESTNL